MSQIVLVVYFRVKPWPWRTVMNTFFVWVRSTTLQALHINLVDRALGPNPTRLSHLLIWRYNIFETTCD